MQELRAKGCDIRAWALGRLHAKWMIADDVIVVGSCNSTESSQNNLERGVRLRRLTAEAIGEEIATFDAYFERGVRFTDGLGCPAPPTPSR